MLELSLTLCRRALANAKDLRILILALAMAVASVGAVSLFAESVQQRLGQQAAALLGADVLLAFDRPLNEVAGPYFEEAKRQGLTTTESVRFMSMVAGTTTKDAPPVLTDVKAVTTLYPLRGQIQTASGKAVSGIPASLEAWIDERLAEKLNIKVGAEVQVGRLSLTIKQVFAEEPEIAGSFITMSPKLIMNSSDLPKSELLQAGNRASHRLHVAGEQSKAYLAWVKQKPMSGLRVDTVGELRPEVRSTLERADKFLSLTALLAVLLAAVAVVLATRHTIARELDNMALLRSLGAAKTELYGLLAVQFLMVLSLALIIGILFAYLGQTLLMFALSPT